MSVAPAANPAESTSIDQGHGPLATPGAAGLPVADDVLYEVVGGQIEEKIAGARQIRVIGILDQLLGAFAMTHRLGRVSPEMLYRIDQVEDLQRRPDVSLVSQARWPLNRPVPDVGAWDLVPDLAIEVISPSNTAREVQRKIHEYFKVGVTRVWVVYPDEREVYVFSSTKQISVHQLGDDLDGGDLLPGFRVPVATLFEAEAEAE
jgi:Uma2 family endonuclease